jgi:hypothetical protein
MLLLRRRCTYAAHGPRPAPGVCIAATAVPLPLSLLLLPELQLLRLWCRLAPALLLAVFTCVG